jgi:putative glycosyltransferase (TIGR04372 family)
LLRLVPALPVFLVIRLLGRFILVRVKPLSSSRIGHYAMDTELYLCERDAGLNVPKRRYVDLFYNEGTPCNAQLAEMWARRLRVWPEWILAGVLRLVRKFPSAAAHEIPDNTQSDRDVNNLLERFSPHLSFTADEERRGREGLKALGIPENAEFVCLIMRDEAYLKAYAPGGRSFDYHRYRNADIANCVEAAEQLAELGYYVLRMGSVVKSPMNAGHRRVIDYATNGMRSEFLDVYLGAKCLCCITCGTGFDAIPMVFRRPLAYVNYAPVGYLLAFLKDAICICKRHWLASEKRWLSLREIFSRGVGFCLSSTCYEANGVILVENTPGEIKGLVMEMVDRLKGTWRAQPEEDALQSRFWEIFPLDATDARGVRIQGKARARYGAQFLRDNPDFLE